MQGQAVGVVECPQDDPDGFMAAFFGEDLVEDDEAFLGQSLRFHGGGGIS